MFVAMDGTVDVSLEGFGFANVWIQFQVYEDWIQYITGWI
jgi:hypothetical protein